MFPRIVSLSFLSTLLVTTAATAAPLTINGKVCVDSLTGALAAKTRCTGRFVPVSINDIAIRGSKGDVGPQGPQGPQGFTGATGPAGAGFTGTIPSGHTMRGYISRNEISWQPGAGHVAASFQSPINAIDSADVIIAPTTPVTDQCSGNLSECLDAEEMTKLSVCQGSVDNPTAPAGKICIYPVTFTGVRAARAIAGARSQYGFDVVFDTPSSDFFFSAVWAYTKP